MVMAAGYEYTVVDMAETGVLVVFMDSIPDPYTLNINRGRSISSSYTSTEYFWGNSVTMGMILGKGSRQNLGKTRLTAKQ